MNKKKILALSAVVILLAGLISGCFDDKHERTEAVKSDISVKTEELVWYIPGETPPDLDSVLNKADEYLKNRLNITLSLRFIPENEYSSQMSVLIRSGEAFDLCFTSADLNSFKQNVYKGAFLQLDALLEKYGGSLKEIVDSRLWKSTNINGGIYAVPANRQAVSSFVWLLNKELCEKHSVNLSENATLKDLEPVLLQISEEEPEYTPFALNQNGLAGVFADFDMAAGENIPAGVSLLGTGGLKAVSVLEDGSVMTQLKILCDFYEKGYINQDAPDTDILPENRFLTSETSGAYAESEWSAVYGDDVLSVQRTSACITTASAAGAFNAVSVTSRHPEKAVELLALVNTDIYLRNLLQYGLENTHYTLTGKTTATLLEKSSDYQVPLSALGNEFITYTLFPDPFDKWEEIKNYNDGALSSPLLGFHFNPEKVSAQLEAVSQVTAQYRPLLFTGAGDFETLYPQVLEDYHKAGLEDVIKEIQLQIDSWTEKTN